MRTPLFRLVYRSASTVGDTPGALAAELDRIVQTSRRNNVGCGITGALYAGTRCFAQVLEGPLSAVEATFERIGRDGRHGSIMVLDIGPTERRAFSDWSMTLVQGHDGALLPSAPHADPAAPKTAADGIIKLLRDAIEMR